MIDNVFLSIQEYSTMLLGHISMIEKPELKARLYKDPLGVLASNVHSASVNIYFSCSLPPVSNFIACMQL